MKTITLIDIFQKTEIEIMYIIHNNIPIFYSKPWRLEDKENTLWTAPLKLINMPKLKKNERGQIVIINGFVYMCIISKSKNINGVFTGEIVDIKDYLSKEYVFQNQTTEALKYIIVKEQENGKMEN